MSKFSRADRRHHHNRIFAKCVRQEYSPYVDKEWILKWSRVRVNTRTLCSCSGCGNPRRHYGNAAAALSRRELRAAGWQKEID